MRDVLPLEPADLERVAQLLAMDPINLTELRRYVGGRAGLGTLVVPDTHGPDDDSVENTAGPASESDDSELVRSIRPLLWKVRKPLWGSVHSSLSSPSTTLTNLAMAAAHTGVARVRAGGGGGPRRPAGAQARRLSCVLLGGATILLGAKRFAG